MRLEQATAQEAYTPYEQAPGQECPGCFMMVLYTLTEAYFTWKKLRCQADFVTFFAGDGIYYPIVCMERRNTMAVFHKEPEDLDDFIFGEYDGGPSQR